MTIYREIEDLLIAPKSGWQINLSDALAILTRHGFTADSDAPASPYPLELQHKMAAFFRDWKVAKYGANFSRRANAIAAEIPKPVDPDWVAAKRLVEREYPEAASQNEHALRKMAMAGIQYARELQKQESRA